MLAIGGGQGRGGGVGTGEMTVGYYAGEGLGIQEAGRGDHAGFGEDFGPIAPDQERVAGARSPLNDMRGGQGVVAEDEIGPIVRTMIDSIQGERGVTRGEADEGDD